MKATMIGFVITTNTPVTFQDLWRWLTSQPKEHEFQKAQRLLYFEEHAGIGYGLVLTTKSHKKACELVSEGGNVKISITQSADNAERIDFNFIVVNLQTQKGLYLQYRGSWNIHSFGMFLNRRFNEAVREFRELAIVEEEVTKYSKAAKAIRSLYAKAELEASVMVRTQQLSTMLRQMKSIKSFEFPLTTLTNRGDTFLPLRGTVREERHRLKFAASASKNTVIRGILDVIGNGAVQTGKVRGTNARGFEESIDLLQNPDVFEYFEFDDIASEQNLSLSNIRASGLVKEMKLFLDANPSLFS